MKLKDTYFYTLRENVKDEDSTSGNLLVRSGMIKKSSAGAYIFLPMGLKILRNIETVIREEINAIGAQELLMPSLIPEEVYINSGRRESFGNNMFSLKDRYGKPFVLGPTHEELFAVAAQANTQSYKDLPFILYQFQNKFRDEPRPRFGLIRTREFIMKDAYTFDIDEDGLNHSYSLIFDAYKKIFDRLKIDYKIVNADTGVMGGLLSEEFQAVSPIGEDTIVLCDNCDLSSNIEITKCVVPSLSTETNKQIEKISTPNAKTIEEVATFLNLPSTQFVKTLIYSIDNKLMAFLVQGNREVNETKLQKLFQANEVVLATADEVLALTGSPIGFVGPVGLNCPIVVDQDVAQMKNFIVGANQIDTHYINVNISDFTCTATEDIRKIESGDICPVCGGKIFFKQGIEVGNTFKLGVKYSEALNLQFLNSENKLQHVWMGSYGIGLARTMAAIAEQYADENGIAWPMIVAPYKVAIVLISDKDDTQVSLASDLYNQLTNAGIECLLDNRNDRPGVKFKDMELIGIPLRITVGKKADTGLVEFKERSNSENQELTVAQCIETIKRILSNQ